MPVTMATQAFQLLADTGFSACIQGLIQGGKPPVSGELCFSSSLMHLSPVSRPLKPDEEKPPAAPRQAPVAMSGSRPRLRLASPQSSQVPSPRPAGPVVCAFLVDKAGAQVLRSAPESERETTNPEELGEVIGVQSVRWEIAPESLTSRFSAGLEGRERPLATAL